MKESLSVRLRRLAAEAFKFLTVGGLGYIVDVGLSNVLAYGLGSIPALLEGSPIKAKIISTIISMVVVWLGNRLWTYGDRTTDSNLRGVLLFVAVNVAGMVISVIPLGATWYLLDMRDQLTYNISTNVIGVGLAMIFRFYAYRTWVFKDAGPDAEVVVEMEEPQRVPEDRD
ncbi:MAG: GtrA family protein [Brevibacterium sp.]|uniref:Flippase GtrA (Transmembrane translocase of bactoprenol-linked glucose) n=1 Tax=Brevibacterium aurantiacum TaxID=273384 RepID=A0A2H1J6L7_BREAU|nr:GtrA family protein [Brevibacterium aurantiacum]SMX83120.1 Putative flippase GtrA (transmembrane translocase of bactoprenol-linked glucose) [Brevibacterium aurantiacum]